MIRSHRAHTHSLFASDFTIFHWFYRSNKNFKVRKSFSKMIKQKKATKRKQRAKMGAEHLW